MATGTGNLPNPGMAFTPFDILTAEEMNMMVDNIESLATGVGIGDGAITSDKIDSATIVAGLGAGVSPTVTNTSTDMATAQKLNLTRTTVQRGNLTLSGGDVRVGAGISAIQASAQVYYTTPLTAGATVRAGIVNITKGERIVRTISRAGGTYTMVTTPSVSASVAEGDIIRLTVSGDTTSAGVGVGNSTFDTFLSVKSI